MSDAATRESGQRLVHAQQDLERAKSQLQETLDKIEHRMSPEGLADDAGRAIQSKIADLGKRSTEAVRERPVTVAAGAGALLALLAGRPLWKASKRLFGGKAAAAAH
jgi:hypothetical protein